MWSVTQWFNKQPWQQKTVVSFPAITELTMKELCLGSMPYVYIPGANPLITQCGLSGDEENEKINDSHPWLPENTIRFQLLNLVQFVNIYGEQAMLIMKFKKENKNHYSLH